MDKTKYIEIESSGNVIPSAPPAPHQTQVKTGIGCFCLVSVYTLWIFFWSIFPIYGQVRAIWICRNWDQYITEEDEETAYFELICASYGLYGIWLSLKCIRKLYWKMWKGSLSMIFQLTDEEKQQYGKMTLLRYLWAWGNVTFYPKCCGCCIETENLLIKKHYDLCQKFCGYAGITILSCGIATIPLLWCELRCFGNKFLAQHDSYFKYTLGHIYKILTCSFVHIIWFIYTRWDSDNVVDRVIANSGYLMWFPLYLVYCYFSYAYSWRYGYAKRMIELNPPSEVPIQATAVLTDRQTFDSIDEHKSNDYIQLATPPVVSAVTIRENTEQKQQSYFSPYSLWVIGSIMYIIGTCGFALIWFAFETIELTDREWQLVRDTCGTYFIYKIWNTPYKWLRRNRYICSNPFSKLFVEFGLFLITFGISYLEDIYKNLNCIPFEKRYTIGALQTLVFAPFFFKNHSNIAIRWISKLVLMGYNFIVYYFIAVAVNYDIVTIPIFVVINYTTYCFYKFFTTNKTILKTFTDIKHMFRDSWLSTKWQLYRLKFNAVNSYRSARNSAKISWCGAKTSFRAWKANSYNSRHRLVEGDPRFKVTKVSQPRLLELKVFKDYNTYHNLYTTKKQNRLPIKNTVVLLKCALNKILKTHHEKTNQCVIHDISLWASRYDDMLGSAPQVLISNLDRNTIITLVNHVTFNIVNKAFPAAVTRKDELNLCSVYYNMLDKQCNYLARLIYELSGINKNTDVSQVAHQLENIVINLNRFVEQLTTTSNQI